MAEYNFKPDYAVWWNKENLSKEEICWLMLGVNPEDAVKYENLSKEEGKIISDDDKKWQHGFSRYLNAFSYGLQSYEEHDFSMKILSWNGDKKAIVKQAYENCRKFSDGFKAFLGKNFPKNKTLEAYKNHENFKSDEPLSLGITTEQDAFAVLLGLKPKDFSRFCALQERQNNEPKDANGCAAYVRFSSEDKWFYLEYRKFIDESFHDVGSCGFVLHAWNEARFLEVWEGDFGKYAQRLYNEGFIFKHSVVEYLKANGISLEYEKSGWAYEFYRYWLKKGGWTANEATYLFKGQSPEQDARSFIDLSQNRGGLSTLHNGLIYAWDNHTLTMERLNRILERHKAMGKVKSYPFKELELYEPKEITEWLLKNTLHIPPKPLLQLLEIPETEEQEKERILANVKASKERARRKPPEIHQCIGWAWNEVKKGNDEKPSAEDVWAKLEASQDTFTCIRRFDISEKTKEKAIFWETGTGITSEIAFSTFSNYVSDYNHGRKIYDPSQNNF
ncbi:MAG: hypothetical protein EOM37_04970 [Proteobacteria bacterium]|nr:hypothetical protein [Pseudomonadota bacterium]